MATFAEVKDAADGPDLVRKPLQGVGFWAPMSVELPASLLDTDGSLKALTSDWRPIGIVSSDGYSFSTDINVEETEGWGYADPIRTDVSKAPKQVKMTPMQKWTRLIQELTQGADYASVTASANGEVVFEEPDIPSFTDGRLLVIGFDGTTAAPFYRGKGFTKVTTSAVGDDAWNASSDAAGVELTLNVGVGPEGFPVRHYYAGSAFVPADYGFGGTAAPGAWQASHAYALDNQVSAGGHVYKVTTAGTSGSTAPTWPASGTVTDGGVTWTFVS